MNLNSYISLLFYLNYFIFNFLLLEGYHQVNKVYSQVAIGQFIQLHCRVNGFPLPAVLWYKNGVPLNIGDRSEVLIGNVTYKMIGSILYVSRNNVNGSGIYQCVATNIAGEGKGRLYKVILTGEF